MTRTEVERITRLEAELDHLSDRVGSMAAKVDQMHELLVQAKGARWAIIGVASLGGGFVAWLARDVLPLLGALPR